MKPLPLLVVTAEVVTEDVVVTDVVVTKEVVVAEETVVVTVSFSYLHTTGD